MSRKSIGFDMDVSGVPFLIRALANQLPKRVYNKVVRRANNMAMTPVVKAAKKGTSIYGKPPRGESTGAMKKALSKRTKQYKASQTTFTVAGAKADAVYPGRPGTAANKPNKYAHLLEFGHRFAPRRKGARLDRMRESIVAGKRVKRFVTGNSQPLNTRARPFPVIGNAYAATKGTIQSIWKKEFRKGLFSELRMLKLRKGP